MISSFPSESVAFLLNPSYFDLFLRFAPSAVYPTSHSHSSSSSSLSITLPPLLPFPYSRLLSSYSLSSFHLLSSSLSLVRCRQAHSSLGLHSTVDRRAKDTRTRPRIAYLPFPFSTLLLLIRPSTSSPSSSAGPFIRFRLPLYTALIR